MNSVLVRRGNSDTPIYQVGALRGRTKGTHIKKAAICKHRGEVSLRAGLLRGESNPANILILDIQAPALRENTFLLFKPPSLGYFISAYQTNTFLCAITLLVQYSILFPLWKFGSVGCSTLVTAWLLRRLLDEVGFPLTLTPLWAGVMIFSHTYV